MNSIETLHAFEQIKLLADGRRLTILRRLMAVPATLSQIGNALGQSPAWVRHHIKALESAGLVEIAEVRTSGIVTEKYYRARAQAFLLRELILPYRKGPFVVLASNDLALRQLATGFHGPFDAFVLADSSLDGLMHLREGLCNLAGAHLLDANGEYNAPFVRHLFPDRPVSLLTLAERTQGLMVAAGNPKGIRTLADLTREEVTFLNRDPGSGTRLWLDRELARQGLPVSAIPGYERYVHTHGEAAHAIQTGTVDVSLGIQAAAHDQGLGFVPLFNERYDLVVPREQESRLAPLLERLHSAAFRKEVGNLPGYSSTHSGEQIPL